MNMMLFGMRLSEFTTKYVKTIAVIIAGLIIAILATIFSGYARAVTITFPRGMAAVDIQLDSQEHCAEPWATLCVTQTGKLKSYLLSITVAELGLQMSATEKFIRMSYFVLLHRPVDAAGLAYYKAAIDAGTITREQMLDTLISSAEYRALRQ